MGLLDEYIEELGVFAFKFKAKAEAKKMGLQGLQEGTDFLASKYSVSYQTIANSFVLFAQLHNPGTLFNRSMLIIISSR